MHDDRVKVCLESRTPACWTSEEQQANNGRAVLGFLVVAVYQRCTEYYLFSKSVLSEYFFSVVVVFNLKYLILSAVYTRRRPPPPLTQQIQYQHGRRRAGRAAKNRRADFV